MQLSCRWRSHELSGSSQAALERRLGSGESQPRNFCFFWFQKKAPQAMRWREKLSISYFYKTPLRQWVNAYNKQNIILLIYALPYAFRHLLFCEKRSKSVGTFACPHTPYATTKRGAESTKAFVRRIPSPAAHSSQYCSSGAAKIGRVGNLIIPTDFATPFAFKYQVLWVLIVW